MATKRLLPVSDLEIGMYIAELDRPWLETPFLFQGFYIRDAGEIEAIRSHCEYVYVSADSLPEMRQTANGESIRRKQANGEAKARKWGFGLRSLFRRAKATNRVEIDVTQTNVLYQESTTLKKELSTAALVKEQATSAIRDVMDSLRTNGHLDIERLELTISPMVSSVLRNPAALACLVRLQKKNEYLYQHSLASSVWATILGRQLGLVREDINALALGAMLLDVGMTQLPGEILVKPGKLDESEIALMRRHVQFGVDILERSGNVDVRVLEMVAHHHERHNGTGYPQGLQGVSIPVFGRIAGIVDAYDAMITPRPYASHVSTHDALRQLRKLADVEFQAEIVDQFTRAIGVFPTGTLVELNTGEVAIVTRQNPIRRLRPEIMIVLDPNKEILAKFRVVDLNEEKVSAKGDVSLWIETGLPPGSHGVDPVEFFLD